MLGLEEIIEVTHAVLFPLLGDIEQLAEQNSVPPHLMRGLVSIEGQSKAIVAVDCSERLARRIGGAMFSTDPSKLSEEEVADALGEIANIIGGNIKALLPGPSRLGLPEIHLNIDYSPESTLVAQAFQCTGEPFRVCLASNSPY